MTTTDADDDTHSYTIAGGTDAASFSINETTGVLSLKAQPDFETQPSYEVAVKTQDAGGKAKVETFTVSVSDVDEAPTLTVPTGGLVTEDAATSTIIGSLVGSDPENDSVTYSVVGSTAISGSGVTATAT